MTFRQAVAAVPALRGHFQPGLQALGTDSRHVRANSPTGSVDFDAALRPLYPSGPRWDYGVGVPGTRGRERVVWVEVHPAATSQVKAVLAKHLALVSWLGSQAPALHALSAGYVWVPSGRNDIRPGTPQARQLATHGVRVCSSPCTLP